MTLHSILNLDHTAEPPTNAAPEELSAFTDLNFDQIVSAVSHLSADYIVAPFFYAPLKTHQAILYRQEVMLELENEEKRVALEEFAHGMRHVRARLQASNKSHWKYERAALFLDAAAIYCGVIERVLGNLEIYKFHSRGIREFRKFLAALAGDSTFKGLALTARDLKGRLSEVSYRVLIRDNSVTVQDSGGEPDYSVMIAGRLANFREEGDLIAHKPEISPIGMTSIEAAIVEMVAKLNPATFSELLTFSKTGADFVHPQVAKFDHEIQFYLCYLEYIDPLRCAGLSFCYPSFTRDGEAVEVIDAFDLALADTLMKQDRNVVRNDVLLSPTERVLVVSGPNQGGKTTFARMVGQLHLLARLGCPVPGARARLVLCDYVLTLFERSETLADLQGALHRDLTRIRNILERGTTHSVIILNELFGSTTLEDALFLSQEIMERLCALNAVAIWVTFLSEMSEWSPKAVSMVAAIASQDNNLRTFKIERRPPRGLADAQTLAGKHRLTYELLKARLPP